METVQPTAEPSAVFPVPVAPHRKPRKLIAIDEGWPEEEGSATETVQAPFFRGLVIALGLTIPFWIAVALIIRSLTLR